ncbi:hypothetical protein ABFS82_06G028800 [Erythranthe guttata]|uniref:probable polygalacturonase n=1 Tax=Erythranthe guttata TaxID=4155 RepID=UPI00064DDB73|nr:PREDICTED: probable polygalacturonase [Erythranthe guttata]|eukprot:XP_012851929.1 PREDICTED: probable polygalacturonase [Erythranthe guttata]
MCSYYKNNLILEGFVICLVLGLVCVSGAEKVEYKAFECRKHSAVLTDFGGKGDGVTSNTAAFKAAIANLSKLASDGGAQLIVPPGKWLTGSFNLTSYFTLYIHKDAVLLASQDESEYPLIDPLPSYGNAAGKRFAGLIFGTNLENVVVTGGNGTIDGQGEIWWKKFKSHKLKNTRPALIEIMNSTIVQITNLTMINSPSSHVHPTYSNGVIIESLTIIAPTDSPNTVGINPDSCEDTRIVRCYIVSGDDCVAVKSGLDQYGIKYDKPTESLAIRRLTCTSPNNAAIALGSEMSGGIQDVRADGVHAVNCKAAVRIETAPGRGGYVKEVYFRNVTLDAVKYAFWLTASNGPHPDEGFDRKALPEVKNITLMNVVGKNVSMVGNLAGIAGDPFIGICISNVTVEMAAEKKLPWNCSDVSGISSGVSPKACDLLPEKREECFYPPIWQMMQIDWIHFKTCST